jgi:hypothetical protein
MARANRHDGQGLGTGHLKRWKALFLLTVDSNPCWV